MKRFIFDSILDEENICNLDHEKAKLGEGVKHGLKLLVYGKRNTGKTSLVKNVVAREWLLNSPSAFLMYVDLMGVKSLTQISERIAIAFSEAYNDTFQVKATFQNMLQLIKGIKPTFELDDKGSPKLSFGINPDSKVQSFVNILIQLENIYHSNTSVLLVLDEFQDIAEIDEAEALFRNSLQNLNSNIPIIILGSKQHLLSKIFARPSAPFFNWGTHINFEDIDYNIYHSYMNDRFEHAGLKISLETSIYLQNKMSRIPEAINRLCFAILTAGIQGEISIENVNKTLAQLISDRRSEPEKYLSSFSIAEQKVIIAIARNEPIKQPQGKVFVQGVKLSSPGVRKIFFKLENEAVVYKEMQGYILADALLKQHILKYRL
jgi:uncharacterized protein